MLPTERLSKMIMDMPDDTADLVLKRRGVCSQVVIPNQVLKDNVVNIGFGLNRSEKTIVLKQGEGLVTLTDEIGISKFTCVDILFITNDIACVELKSGSMFLKNANGVEYGFDDGGHLIRNLKGVKWVDLNSLYDICKDKIISAYHTDAADALNYVANAVFNMTLKYTENSPSVAKSTGCYSNTYYGVTAIYNTIALGEFEFTVFEKVEPVKRSYMADIWHKDEDELLDELSEQADLEALEDEEVAGLFGEDDEDASDELYESMTEPPLESDEGWFE